MFLSSCRNRSIFTLFLVFFFSQNVFAGTLFIADNLVLRELDDKAVDDGFFAATFSSAKSIKISKGKHTLLIKYKDVYEDIDFAEERLVESELFIVKFSLTDQQTVKLMTPKIADLSAAEKFSQSPEIMLVDENNVAIVLKLEKYDDYKLAKQIEKTVTSLAMNSAVTDKAKTAKVSNKAVAVAPTKATSQEAAFHEQVLTHTESLPMLKYWWHRASEKDKQDFKRHMETLK